MIPNRTIITDWDYANNPTTLRTLKHAQELGYTLVLAIHQPEAEPQYNPETHEIAFDITLTNHNKGKAKSEFLEECYELLAQTRSVPSVSIGVYEYERIAINLHG